MSKPSYTAADIDVLKGLEPVRHRPGMYTRTENPLHILQEAIDNAADEALAGYCTLIDVTLHKDSSVPKSSAKISFWRGQRISSRVSRAT